MTEIIVNGIVSLGAAFLGAWFAYRFNLRQQKKWDKERKDEEQEDQRAKQVLELNYLQTYLHARIDDLCEIYEKIDAQRKLYNRTKSNSYQILKRDENDFFVTYVEFSSKFSCNWDALAFTRNEPEFIYTLGRVETAWHRFVLDHRFGVQHFEKNVALIKANLKKEPSGQQQHLIMKEFVDSQLFNYESEIFRLQEAVSYLNMMIDIFNKYIKKYGYQDSLKSIKYDQKTNEFVMHCVSETPIIYTLRKTPKGK